MITTMSKGKQMLIGVPIVLIIYLILQFTMTESGDKNLKSILMFITIVSVVSVIKLLSKR